MNEWIWYMYLQILFINIHFKEYLIRYYFSKQHSISLIKYITIQTHANIYLKMYNMGSLNSLAYLDDIVRWNILKCIRYDERFVSGIYLYGELIIFE